MHLRKATLEDIPSIMTLVRRVVPLMRASGNLQWDNEYPNPRVFLRDIELKQLWIAEIDGEVAGIAAITEDQEPGYATVGWDIEERSIVVHRLAVDPGFQGRGVARVLMLKAEQEATERGITVLRVDTNTNNAATQSLFPKLGYTLSGEILLDYRPGLRFVGYEKRLVTS